MGIMNCCVAQSCIEQNSCAFHFYQNAQPPFSQETKIGCILSKSSNCYCHGFLNLLRSKSKGFDQPDKNVCLLPPRILPQTREIVDAPRLLTQLLSLRFPQCSILSLLSLPASLSSAGEVYLPTSPLFTPFLAHTQMSSCRSCPLPCVLLPTRSAAGWQTGFPSRAGAA
jgi:hypothetical protein